MANYAQYEQLIGGVETLFKDSAGAVTAYAENAYKTAGMSANAYMETVTAFSASLIQSLGGDTAAAAKYADLAITDMADNANKMGSDISSIQNAYQGFAKQNYTMLDNLKLGYGGTKEEMERLLADAEAISGVDFDIASYADVVQAIHVIQEEMGIAGATAAEASTTISGSFNALKASWENLITGLATGEDLGGLIGNVVESATTVAGNIMPVISQVLVGAGALVEGLAPIIGEQLPAIISSTLPALISAGGSLLMSLIDGFLAAAPAIESSIPTILQNLIAAIVQYAPELMSAAVSLIGALVSGLIQSIPALIAAVPELIMALITSFMQLVAQFADIGTNIVEGIRNGIAGAWDALFGWVSEKFSGLIGGVKKILGIASPSKVFAQIGGFMAEGVGVGWGNEFDSIKSHIESDINFESGTVSPTYSMAQASFVGGLFGGGAVEKLDQIIYLLSNQALILDDGTLVGKMAPAMDSALGELAIKRGRGR